MGSSKVSGSERRYTSPTHEKSEGIAYTPTALADFVAGTIVGCGSTLAGKQTVSILDPAVGDGELLVSLVRQLAGAKVPEVNVYGFETSEDALESATVRLRALGSCATIDLRHGDFLAFALDYGEASGSGSLFTPTMPTQFDAVIANPPYVRTQVLGATRAQQIARQFSLSGRVDLYYAFILGIARVLAPGAAASVIVSNRFMTTRAGAAVRAAVRAEFTIRHVWDLGDTRIFRAAVLPAVLALEKRQAPPSGVPAFTSVYETDTEPTGRCADAIDALSANGVVQIADGRRLRVRQGVLSEGDSPQAVWRIATLAGEAWLQAVADRTWQTFGHVGKIRVGVKTCADKVFIRSDWQDMPASDRPELLRPLTTHHVARRFMPEESLPARLIVYPHESVDGKRRAVDLVKYPKTEAYLDQHRDVLESRSYVAESGRRWYEIWVPQDPALWSEVKLVFRDIAAEPTFWIDDQGTVVNGDCYWMACRRPQHEDLLWLAAAVGNSTFIEQFYDYRFHNKLYAGRRRFITQYVEQFPLPDPQGEIARVIVQESKRVFSGMASSETEARQADIDRLVWRAFGVSGEETVR